MCRKSGDIDHEQATGQVSIMCEPPCKFHSKVIVNPLIPIDEVLPGNTTFRIREA